MTTDLFKHKIKKMDDESCYGLALSYGRIMERGNMTKEEKYRAALIFQECLDRSTLEHHKDTFLIALRVLRYF